MTVEHTAHPAGLGAALVVDELIAAGTTDVVICPGSRSTPLAYAFAHAHQAGHIRMHLRSDERTAAFLALGLARATGQVTPIVMTSGSAVTHCFPAVVEASLSGIPLLVLSANRPWTWWGSGASQTIDQPNLFGRYVTRYEGIDCTATTPDPARTRAAVDRIIHAATGANPHGHPAPGGPAHIDMAFDTPLVPEDLDALAQAAQWARGTGRDGIYTRVVAAEHIDSPRILHIAGDGGLTLDGVPTVAEPTAAQPSPELRLNPLCVGLLDPTHIIVSGRPTLHRAVTSLLGRHDVPITILSSTVSGPTGAYDAPNPCATARTITSQVTVSGVDPAWVARARQLSDAADCRVRTVLAAENPQEMTGLRVAAVVANQLRSTDTLLVGASTPIRDLSLVTWASGVRVLSNRGAAGIDGFLSTAIGQALGHPGHTIALCGDLTFLHDITALTPTQTQWPDNLVIVVANDGGGAIFETLEPGKPALRPHFEGLIATAHSTNIEQLCAGMGVAYRRADTPEALADALAGHRRDGGLVVVEARCQRHTRRQLARDLARDLESRRG